ncbi:PEP-CTERM sorting domain-containing protein [Crenobacter caeni]|uniref:PEP-CTERM sorting domain-containing protein n=1 Tax=Crenobacter caeni TaxID=2705474 RepID=A0A6B2KMK1_9NEIS|nr:PEP-CTERM sorting domain-containing protein [Crenobacter caeni]NDV11384.1 PEP-CTERM sorting domain-containing protein [Crenobacter caeni]
MKAKKSLAGVAMLTLTLGLAGGAHAQLFKRDLLAGDQLLVFDNASGLEWLQPVATLGGGYEGAVVKSVMSTYGLRYASSQEVQQLIQGNFGELVLFPDHIYKKENGPVLNSFYEWFDPMSRSSFDDDYGKDLWANSADAVHGYSWSSISGGAPFVFEGSQIRGTWPLAGNWLVRPVSPVPEPASALLMLSGLGVVGWWRRNRGRE